MLNETEAAVCAAVCAAARRMAGRPASRRASTVASTGAVTAAADPVSIVRREIFITETPLDRAGQYAPNASMNASGVCTMLLQVDSAKLSAPPAHSWSRPADHIDS